jgi:hypothetical protein
MKLYALPTGKTLRPSNPIDSFYIDRNDEVTVLVLEKDNGKHVAYTTFGSVRDSGIEVDTYADVRWSKSGNAVSYRGLRVAGIRHQDGFTEGYVPSSKLAHWVAK